MFSALFPFLKKDEPAKVHIRIDRERFGLKEQNTLELLRENRCSSIRLTLLLARFMVDEKGEYLDTEKAVDILESLSDTELKDTGQKFTDAIAEASVPKASGNPSPSPSEAGAATDSLTGS